MEALLNVTKKLGSSYEDRRLPPEIHTHDIMEGDLITLEAMGQRYLVHVVHITPETVTLEVQGLSTIDGRRDGQGRQPGIFRSYTLPRNSPLSLTIPMLEKGPTWVFEWTNASPTRQFSQ
jgi:hypothetical protein